MDDEARNLFTCVSLVCLYGATIYSVQASVCFNRYGSYGVLNPRWNDSLFLLISAPFD
jgi:hypothetical protein